MILSTVYLTQFCIIDYQHGIYLRGSKQGARRTEAALIRLLLLNSCLFTRRKLGRSYIYCLLSSRRRMTRYQGENWLASLAWPWQDFFLIIFSLLYSNIKLVFHSASVSTSIGVRQGAASSCILFIIYLDIMVRMINTVETDGFLTSLHALLLMDDTVLLATGRILEIFHIVQLFKQNLWLSTTLPIIAEGFIVAYSSSYLYLGTYITDDGISWYLYYR